MARSDPGVSRCEGEDVTFGKGTSVHGTVLWEATPYFFGRGLPVFRCKLLSPSANIFFPPESGSSRITRLRIPPGFTFIVTVVRNQNPRKSVHFNNKFSLNSYLKRQLSTIFFLKSVHSVSGVHPLTYSLGRGAHYPG